ncbi:MAG: hypothetical protein J6S67_19000 [Methanobrevibacter sp.]|nr:hypothetical protein [Methanobrevibacter sp.]
MKTEKKITATIEVQTHEVLTLNRNTNETSIRTYVTEKMKPEKALKYIQNDYKNKDIMPLYILSTKCDTYKYCMSESVFIKESEALNARPTNIRYITRTCTSYVCSALFIDTSTNETFTRTEITGNVKSDNDAVAIINSKYHGTVIKCLYIFDRETKTELRGMSELKFMTIGTIVTE